MDGQYRDVPTIDRITRDRDAREMAIEAYALMLAELESLTEEEWDAPTPCEPWTVADLVGHLIGAAKSHVSVRELLRQQLLGFRHRSAFDGNSLDAVNDLQVREHRALSPQERLDTLRRLVPAAVDGRMSAPSLIRRIDVPLDAGGSMPPGMPKRLNLGHLLDTVYTRDVWLHRFDVATAVGRQVPVDHAVDRRIVEDVVAEWAQRHGRPFRLELTGPAGGRFRQGDGGPQLTRDAVGFCLALSGREPAEGLLATRVVF